MGKQQLTTEQFIERANIIHQHKYDYSNTNYTISHNYVDVICPIHGNFKIKAYAHLQGKGCRLCAIEAKARNRQSNTEELIQRSKELFGETTYDYSKTKYGNNNKEKVIITCPKHGDFRITPNNHLSNKIGCPHCVCKSSKYEKEIFDLLRNNLNENIEIITKDRSILKTQEIDILIPQLKIGIEFNGIRWHSHKFGGKSKDYHLNKTINCNKQGIRLIHVFENEYLENKKLALFKILHKCGINNTISTIYAKNCQIEEREATDKEVQLFLQNNIFSDTYQNDFKRVLTCLCNKEIVGIICYNIIENTAFINHLTTSYKYKCIGVMSKLLKALKRINPNVESLHIMADRRWLLDIENNSLTKLGFKINSISEPRKLYYSVSTNQEKLFLNTLNVDDLDWVYDCGLIEYIKEI